VVQFGIALVYVVLLLPSVAPPPVVAVVELNVSSFSPLLSAWSRNFIAHYRAIFATGAIVAALFHAHHELGQKRAFEHAAAQVDATAPAGPPPLTQESIDLAMQIYGIEVPSSADAPMLDLGMQDRGLTTRSPFMDKAKVTIGPAAFSSWALLGSTIAHEVEVHCQQNFFAIYLMDLVGLDGTGTAERQAYVHELANAHRFGTAHEDTRMIADTVSFYYPEEQGSRTISSALSIPVKAWLARALISGNSTVAAQ
jgi:hypothetical protein